jgi:hypothetical protein
MTWFVPTEFFGSFVAAYAPPPRATKRATRATIMAGDGRLIRGRCFFTLFSSHR